MKVSWWKFKNIFFPGSCQKCYKMLFFSLNVKIPNTLVLMKWDNIYVLASEASSSSRIPQKKLKKLLWLNRRPSFYWMWDFCRGASHSGNGPFERCSGCNVIYGVTKPFLIAQAVFKHWPSSMASFNFIFNLFEWQYKFIKNLGSGCDLKSYKTLARNQCDQKKIAKCP